MAYSQSVYLKAKAELERRRKKALSDRDARHSAALLRCKGLAEVESEMSSYGAQVVKAVAMGQDASDYIQKLAKKSHDAQQKRKQLLVASGFPENYLDVNYTCPVCSDTGSHNGYYCTCYKKLIEKYALERLGVYEIEKSSFETFKTDYYPDVTDGLLGVSQKEHMKDVLEYCRQYALHFSKNSGGIIMLGKTGLGKTHLSLAIAQSVTKRGYNVYYSSVQNVMSTIEKEHFKRNAVDESIDEELFESDLLILDDLGAEFSTSFVTAQLGNILNTRMTKNLPIIISTNLTMQEIEEKYSQRIASRIMGSMMPLMFCGRDIRQIKNM